MTHTGLARTLARENPSDDSQRSLAAARAEIAAANAAADKYRKAAEHLARQCAESMVRYEQERSALLDDHDAFIVQLTEEHDKLIGVLARERDQARELASEAIITRDGVAAASKRVARERTQARRELGEVALDRDIARRDAARSLRQLADAREEINRLRRELEYLALLAKSLPSPEP